MRDWLFDNVIIWLFARQLDAWADGRFVSGVDAQRRYGAMVEEHIYDLRRIAFDAGRLTR